MMNWCCVCPQGRPGVNGRKGEKGESVGLPVSTSMCRVFLLSWNALKIIFDQIQVHQSILLSSFTHVFTQNCMRSRLLPLTLFKASSIYKGLRRTLQARSSCFYLRNKRHSSFKGSCANFTSQQHRHEASSVAQNQSRFSWLYPCVVFGSFWPGADFPLPENAS